MGSEVLCVFVVDIHYYTHDVCGTVLHSFLQTCSDIYLQIKCGSLLIIIIRNHVITGQLFRANVTQS